MSIFLEVIIRNFGRSHWTNFDVEEKSISRNCLNLQLAKIDKK